MKSFLQFLTEATQSQAAMQAKKLGLKGDGHGGWIDRAGKVVARTEKGKKNQKQILKNLLLLHPQQKQKQHKHLHQNLKHQKNQHLKINHKKFHHLRLYLVGLIHQQ
jgi:hypothetical protein